MEVIVLDDDENTPPLNRDFFQRKRKKGQIQTVVDLTEDDGSQPKEEANITPKRKSPFKPKRISVVSSPTASPSSSQSSQSSQTSSQSSQDDPPIKQDEEKYVPEYYLTNFFIIMDQVYEEHRHLFTESELNITCEFRKLSEAQQRLYIRLYNRKGPWFRISTLKYPPQEIPDLQDTAQGLQKLGFAEVIKASTLSNAQLPKLMEVVSTSELRNIAKAAGVASPGKDNVSREELIERLLKQKTQRTIFGTSVIIQQVAKTLGDCIRLSDESKSVFDRMMSLFYLNLWNTQDDTQSNLLLLRDMGFVSFPAYTITKKNKIFESRSDLLIYEEAINLSKIYNDAIARQDRSFALEIAFSCARWLIGCSNAANDPLKLAEISSESLEQSLNQVATDFYPGKEAGFNSKLNFEEIKLRVDNHLYLARFTWGWVMSQIVVQGVDVLEKEKDYVGATVLLRILLSGAYAPGKRGKWWERLTLDFEHLGKKEDSLHLCETALKDATVSRAFMTGIHSRLCRLSKPPRRWKPPPPLPFPVLAPNEVTIFGKLLTSVTGVKSKFQSIAGGPVTVEAYAMEYYGTEGWESLHSEGSVFRALFSILMWDVIFAEIPDVFQTPFQDAPLDLLTDAFFSSRRELVERKLEEISSNSQLDELVESSWKLHHGISCRGISWEFHNLEKLKQISICFGGKALAGMFRLFCEDYKGWSSGLPDLILWKSEQKLGKLSEVKGPRDRLSNKQRAWITQLVSFGVQIDVCYVKEYD
eukprot:TRINITY_DN9672_c0_g1_i1.p1 TRINITY_DN9672_c0_g1~~TRINITY_DN9672_c0_g1_i1.p1  ORF type:complete len:756 (-),score=205.73 TRINITY_DN9672_c0_g1_i1:194-2461(-)